VPFFGCFTIPIAPGLVMLVGPGILPRAFVFFFATAMMLLSASFIGCLAANPQLNTQYPSDIFPRNKELLICLLLGFSLRLPLNHEPVFGQGIMQKFAPDLDMAFDSVETGRAHAAFQVGHNNAIGEAFALTVAEGATVVPNLHLVHLLARNLHTQWRP
jgi:hypothetical protein